MKPPDGVYAFDPLSCLQYTPLQMVISPIMRYILEKEEGGYPSPTEREKLNKAIARYRNIIKSVPSGPLIGEIKFGLADLLVGRDEEGDYKEAQHLYGEIVNTAPKGYLWAKAVVGHAEILIRLGNGDDVEAAVKAVGEARETLQKFVGNRDFFTVKSLAVEAELLTKESLEKHHAEVIHIHDKVIKWSSDHAYFKARSEVGKAESLLYFYPKKLLEAFRLCQDAQKTLRDRPDDYFALKSKVLQVEILARKGTPTDLQRADKISKALLDHREVPQELRARTMLALAQITRHPKAEKFSTEVLQMEGLDPYLVEKARQIAQGLRSKQRSGARR